MYGIEACFQKMCLGELIRGQKGGFCLFLVEKLGGFDL
jgi:hypothetical protein